MTILKNVPIPDPVSKYPELDQLEVGEATTFGNEVNALGLYASITYRQQRYGKKFTRRTQDGIVTVWRTA